MVLARTGLLPPEVDAGAVAAGRLVEAMPVVATVGRDDVVAQIDASARAGRSTLLRGPAGVGKSHLARTVAWRLTVGERAPEEILGGWSTASVPLGAVAHLVPVLAGELPVVALIAATLEGLRRRAGEEGLVVVADDVDLLDDASMTLLAYLVVEPGIVVLATARQTQRAPGPLADLLRGDRFDIVDVEPLAAVHTAALAASMVGQDIDPHAARRVHGVTGGNPFWVVELVRAAIDNDALIAGSAGIKVDTALALRRTQRGGGRPALSRR